MKLTTLIDSKAVGQRIREQRELLELSREEFAEIVKLSDYYVGQLERGERQMSLNVLVKIANCLHVSLDYLIFGHKTPQAYYAHDIHNHYKTEANNQYDEINMLLNKCSAKELKLIKKLLKTILPYIKD
ncbi:MAG: helix-turn-helix transcriptional regulator [Clostridia bacterium]|nr:helix-turn-helix transcriptional regulator [Clostridia bacterium]